jgi:hypothetical protein
MLLVFEALRRHSEVHLWPYTLARDVDLKTAICLGCCYKAFNVNDRALDPGAVIVLD